MRVGGKEIPKSNEIVIPIIRGEETYYLKAIAVQVNKEFDEILPEPQPPYMIKPGSRQQIANVDDPKYVEAKSKRDSYRFDFMMVKSLTAPEGLEWDTITLSDPDTWKNWRTELMENGFNEIECGRIIKAVLQVNSLDDDIIEQKRKDFLLLTPQDLAQ